MVRKGSRYIRLGVRQRDVIARALASSLGLVYPVGRENEACYALHARGLLVHALGYPGAWCLARPQRDAHHLRETLRLHGKDPR